MSWRSRASSRSGASARASRRRSPELAPGRPNVVAIARGLGRRALADAERAHGHGRRRRDDRSVRAAARGRAALRPRLVRHEGKPRRVHARDGRGEASRLARGRDPDGCRRRGVRERRDRGDRGQSCGGRSDRDGADRAAARGCAPRLRGHSRSRPTAVRRTARGRIWASTRSRRWAASSSASRSSIADSARTRRTRASGAGASTRRSSRAGRSSRAIRRAACSRPSAARFRARRPSSPSRSCGRSSREPARATRTSRPSSASRSRASRSRSRRTRRSCRPCAATRRPFSAPSRRSSACRSGRTRRSSPQRGSRPCSSARIGEGAHAEVEWVDVASLEQCVEIYVACRRRALRLAPEERRDRARRLLEGVPE